MVRIPEKVATAWSEKVNAPIFTTVGSDGTPNSIYATCMRIYGDDMLVIADNFFSKTKKNIMEGSKGTVLFITKENTSFQIKGSLEYVTEGSYFDFMKSWNPKKLPGHAAVALKVEAVFSGSDKLA